MNTEATETELRNVDEEGVPIQPRIPTAEALRNMHDDFCRNDVDAAKSRLRLSRAANNAAPFDPQKLIDAGESYRANYSTGRFGSIIDTRCSADANLVFDVAKCIQVSFMPGFFKDRWMAVKYGHKIAIAYTQVLKESLRVNEATQRVIRDKNLFGLGFFLSMDKTDWRSRAVPRDSVHFNPSAKADYTGLTEVTVTDYYTISELFARIENPKSSERNGWNIDSLKKALAHFYYNKDQITKDYNGNYMLAWESLENSIRNYDAGTLSRQHELFPVIHGLVEERTGKVSMYTIAQDQASGPDVYLVDAFEQFDSMEEVILPFAYDYGNGELGGVKGLGHRVFPACTADLRLMMKTHDAIELSSAMVVTEQTGSGDVSASIQRFGAFVALSRNITPLNQAFQPNLTSAFSFREAILRGMDNIAGIYRPQQEDPSGTQSQKTAEQVRTDSSRETKFKNDQTFLAYLRWDMWHTQNMRRLLDPITRSSAAPKEARESSKLFIQILESLAVPEELYTKFKKNIIVKATRSVGAGSPYTKSQSLLAVRNVAGTDMTEAGRKHVSLEYTASQIGYENLELYFDVTGEGEQPSNETSIANLENNDFLEGTSVIVGIDQNHVAHIVTHLAIMVQGMQTVMQDPQADPVPVANSLENGIPHTMRHIQILGSDPTRKEQVAQYVQTVEKLTEFYQQLAPAVEQIRKKQAEEFAQMQQQRDQALAQADSSEREYALKNKVADQNHAVELKKADSLNMARESKTQTSQSTAIQKMMADQERKNYLFQNDMQKSMQEHQVKMEQEYAKLALAQQKALQKGSEG